MATKIVYEMEEAVKRINTASYTSMRRYWFTKAYNLYNLHPTIARTWEYVANAYHYVDRFVKRAKVWVSPSKCIDWNDIRPMEKGTNQVYLVCFFNENEEVVYSKIGTTTRYTKKRMIEHLSNYRKDGVCFAKVLRLWNCGDLAPEGLESMFRAHYIAKFPAGVFIKNDRFAGVEFDLEEADDIANNYLRK